MLLGTHPIPARSPAEREGQKKKEMRGREGDEEEGWGVCGWRMGISRRNDWGRRQRKKWGFWEDDGYSRGREERENGGITCYVNEREWLIRAREYNQQLTVSKSGHINLRLRQLKACPHVQGKRRKHG